MLAARGQTEDAIAEAQGALEIYRRKGDRSRAPLAEAQLAQLGR
ncbi:MAG: hypothetical protein ACLPV4_18440 [Solirubrobacteraceae bacterium]